MNLERLKTTYNLRIPPNESVPDDTFQRAHQEFVKLFPGSESEWLKKRIKSIDDSDKYFRYNVITFIEEYHNKHICGQLVFQLREVQTCVRVVISICVVLVALLLFIAFNMSLREREDMECTQSAHKKTMEELQKTKDECTKERSTHKITMEELQKTKDEFTEERSAHKKTMEELQKTKAECTKERSAHNKTMEELQKTNAEFTKERSAHNTTMEELQKTMKLLETEKKTLTDTIEERENCMKIALSHQSTIHILQEDVRRVHLNNTYLTNEIYRTEKSLNETKRLHSDCIHALNKYLNG